MDELYIVVTDETEASEQQGYDVDVWGDDQNGRNEELSIVGLSKEAAEQYVEDLKERYNVTVIRWE
ncbi:hypothetical protein D3C73_278270 [compost metagenome]